MNRLDALLDEVSARSVFSEARAVVPRRGQVCIDWSSLGAALASLPAPTCFEDLT